MSSGRVWPVLVAVAVACSHSQAREAPTPQSAPGADSGGAVRVGMATTEVAAPRSGIEGFMPAFPAADSGGVCGYPPSQALGPGEWVASLAFPSAVKPTRRVTVRYDSTGTLTYYSDERGDVTPPHLVRASDGTTRLVWPAGRRTEITIAVSRAIGLARNVGGGSAEESYTGPIQTMLQAPNLGYPARMAARVRERCRQGSEPRHHR